MLSKIAAFSFGLFIICSLQYVFGQQVGTKFSLTNPLPEERKDEVVVFTKTQFTALTGNTVKNQFAIITDIKGNKIPSQIDDLDEDGDWDEIAMLVSLKASKKAVFRVVYSLKKPIYKPLAHCRLGKSAKRDDIFVNTKHEIRPKSHKPSDLPYLYQNEGPVIENNKVAFRCFFDSRNTMDVLGKRVSTMVADSIGIGHDIDKLADWGMDIMQEGKSLGAGGLGFLDTRTDSIYRLGETEKAEATLISDGPVRTIIKLKYTGWKVLEDNITLTQTLILPANTYAYESRVSLEGKTNPNLQLFTGITKRFVRLVSNTGVNDNYYMVATLDKQSAIDDYLGLGILVENSFDPYMSSIKNPQPTEDSFYMTMSNPRNQFKYYVASCWEKSDARFIFRSNFFSYLRTLADRAASPIYISK